MKRWPFLGVLLAQLAHAQPVPLPTVGVWGVIGRAVVNVNATGDTFLPVTDAGYAYIQGVNNGPANSAYLWIGACSGTFTTFQGALWSGPGGTGSNLTLTASFPGASPTTLSQVKGVPGSTFIWNHAAQPGLYFNVTTPQGTPGTCTVWLLGTMLPTP